MTRRWRVSNYSDISCDESPNEMWSVIGGETAVEESRKCPFFRDVAGTNTCKPLFRNEILTGVHFLVMSRYLTTVHFLGLQPAQLLDQSLSRDAEDARGATLVPCGQAQRFADVIRLDLCQRRQRIDLS